MGTKLKKPFFLPIVSHKQLNYAFQLVEHFRGNSQRTSLFSPKMAITEKSTEIFRNLFFLTCLKRVNRD